MAEVGACEQKGSERRQPMAGYCNGAVFVFGVSLRRSVSPLVRYATLGAKNEVASHADSRCKLRATKRNPIPIQHSDHLIRYSTPNFTIPTIPVLLRTFSTGRILQKTLLWILTLR